MSYGHGNRPTLVADALHLMPPCQGEASGSSRSRTLCVVVVASISLRRFRAKRPFPSSALRHGSFSTLLNSNKLPMLSLNGFQPLEESRKQLLLCQGERAFIFHLCDLGWSFACLIEVVGNDLRVWECSGLYNVGIELNNSRMSCL